VANKTFCFSIAFSTTAYTVAFILEHYHGNGYISPVRDLRVAMHTKYDYSVLQLNTLEVMYEQIPICENT
jgi:hypothetical protein